MSVKKLPTSISLAISIQNGVDSDGNPKYSKKSFSGVKETELWVNEIRIISSISHLVFLAFESKKEKLSENVYLKHFSFTQNILWFNNITTFYLV